jgi:uncharacterized protein (TIGR02453 family)
MLQKETLSFFNELRENNHKDWFDLNRDRYQNAKKDYLKMVAEILSGMQKYDSGLLHLQPKDCIFRINRDIRFSKDKSPYKTHLGIIMTPGGRKLENAGYYVHLDQAEGSFAGGGIYMPSGEILKKIRKEVSVFYEDLEEILKSPDFKKVYGDMDRSKDITLTRPPKGYEESDPAIDFLKLKSFTASSSLDADIFTDPDGVKKIVSILSKLKPLIGFLNRALQE